MDKHKLNKPAKLINQCVNMDKHKLSKSAKPINQCVNMAPLPRQFDYIFTNSFTKPTLVNIKNHTLYLWEKCPVCKTAQQILYRYLDRVCDKCLVKYYMLDNSGNRMLVGNLGIAGGIQAFKLIADSSGELHRVELPYALMYECTINSVKCVIQECVYGGLRGTKVPLK